MQESPRASSGLVPFLMGHALTFKLGWVMFLVLVLLIPLAMIRSLLGERMQRRDQAVEEITGSWGREQKVVGPVLVVPYRYQVINWKETGRMINGAVERLQVEETATANAYFLPEQLQIEGSAPSDVLHRGIYNAVVYRARLNLTGRFAPPDFAELGIAPEDVLWANALVTLAVSDLRGTGEMLGIRLGANDYRFTPGGRLPGYASGVNAKVPDLAEMGEALDFSMALELKGSRGIGFAPVGQQNTVNLASDWPAPSFRGAFLPTERSLRPDGFEAAWQVSWYGRDYPQMGTDQSTSAIRAETVEPSTFGVDLLPPLDSYRMVERATKYGILFIALVFTAFFLFEVMAALRIHTIQYTLVGAAQCLFYLALLSLSEFIRFDYAYWAGALASALLIVLYSLAVLGSGRRTLIIAASLAAIYGFLYVVLQLQSYSLLFGTAALFAVLGILMYATRKTDWSVRG